VDFSKTIISSDGWGCRVTDKAVSWKCQNCGKKIRAGSLDPSSDFCSCSVKDRRPIQMLAKDVVTKKTIVFYSRVVDLSEREQIVSTEILDRQKPMTPDNVEITKKQLGWFMRLDGSRESLFVGDEKPDFEVGQKVKVTIEGAST
jgi:hypothetical protein